MTFLSFYFAVGVVAVQFRNSLLQTPPFFRSVQINGMPTCASDTPFYTAPVEELVGFPHGIPDVVRCSYTCTTMVSTSHGSCSGFNYIDEMALPGSALCQFFNCSSLNCNISSSGCTHYQVGNSNADDTVCRFQPGAIDVSQNCSFPFTYNGGLYYQCVATDYNDCNQRPRCLLASSDTLTFCSEKVKSYVVRNVTVNVTIPLVASPVPLMTVNNWITILSRVDSTFPTDYGTSSQYYTIGFGDILTNYWLGLEKIYKLTNAGINGGKTYRLRFEVLLPGSKWGSREYDWFYLDESPSYKFRSSATSTGDAADAINVVASPANNQTWMSSTTSSCCKKYGPWWYISTSSCGFSRMLGPNNNSVAGFVWGTKSPQNNLQAARMMVKLVV